MNLFLQVAAGGPSITGQMLDFCFLFFLRRQITFLPVGVSEGGHTGTLPPPHAAHSYLTRTICVEAWTDPRGRRNREDGGGISSVWLTTSPQVQTEPPDWNLKRRRGFERASFLPAPGRGRRTTCLEMSLQRWACVAALVCVGGASATPLIFDMLLEGSAGEEEPGNFTSARPPSERRTTAAGPTQRREESVYGRVVSFLEENMLLVLVASTLLLAVALVVCGAVFMSRRRKVNAYYPCSFPSKMYVDGRDKTGGLKPFNEVPEKAAPEPDGEPADSHRQLQADIMRAARSLRTPNKTAGAADGGEPARTAPENAAEGRRTPEPDRGEEPSEGEAGDESEEPAAGRSPRPSSLHIHSDSATLQLIAGEKTAF